MKVGIIGWKRGRGESEVERGWRIGAGADSMWNVHAEVVHGQTMGG